MDGDSTKVTHRRSVDEHGRVIPMTEAEVKARAEEIARGLAAIDDMADEDEQRQSLDALIEALGEHRFFSDKPYPEDGRVIPMTEAEVKAQAPEIARGLAAIDDMGDEDEQRQTLDALIQAIDEGPPEYRMSDRKKFG